MRLLIVEDEFLTALAMKQALTVAGHRVTYIPEPPDAAGFVEGAAFDLALVDMDLAHGHSGAKGAQVLWAARRVPSLFVTGNMAAARQAREVALGCLGKPFRDRALVMAVATMERLLAGKKPAWLPYGLELFERARTWPAGRGTLDRRRPEP